MLPQAAQARKAIWNAVNPHTGKRRILEAFPAELIENMNDNEMFIRFKTNSTFQVVGSDNYNSLVGTPPVGITFSEWALANPTAWAYLSPILAENGGWASFITTPRGNNHAKKMFDAVKDDERWFTQVLSVDKTRAISSESIEEQRVTYRALFGDEIADMLIEQEFYCSFAGALVGSYFGTAMAAAEREGRIRSVPVDPRYPVHTAWDLGKAANNPIWCFQVIDGIPHIVDFYRPDSDDLEEWVKWLDERGYKGNDYVPHDILVAEWGTKRTRFETLKLLGRRPVRVAKVSVAEGIHAARQTIKVAVFDEGNCGELGIEGLKQFRREWDEELKVFRDNPVKDWCEHIASSFRYLGLAWKDAATKEQPPQKPKALEYKVGPTGVIQGNMSVKDAVAAMVRRRREREN